MTDLGTVEGLLESTLASGDPFLREVAVYLLRAGGKRLRPRLVLLGTQFGNGEAGEQPGYLAAAVELVHMATLLHDDVIDGASTRRGLPTVNARWDNRTSVLAGDYLFATAFQFVASRAGPEAWRALSAVVRAMVEAEIQELEARGRLDVTEEEYLDRIGKKTALFMAECPQLGALAANAAPGHRDALGRYGYHLGMAYQVLDDVLDLTADRNTLGKPTGSDIRRGVITLPVIHGLHAPGDTPVRLRAVLSRSAARERDRRDVARILEQGGCIAYARTVAQRFLEQARQALRALPPVMARDDLEGITRLVEARDH